MNKPRRKEQTKEKRTNHNPLMREIQFIFYYVNPKGTLYTMNFLCKHINIEDLLLFHCVKKKRRGVG